LVGSAREEASAIGLAIIPARWENAFDAMMATGTGLWPYRNPFCREFGAVGGFMV